MIDFQTNEDLKAKYAPPGSIEYRHQKRLLEILVYIDNICRENNINYWLGSGTLLGAVRHGGFIPWDDDVDIAMTMEDYRKFEKIVLQDDKYKLQTRFTDPFYSAPYAKLRDTQSEIDESPQDGNYLFKGIYVDIFIVEKSQSRFIAALFGRLTWNLVLYGGKVRTAAEKRFYRLRKAALYTLIDMVRAIQNVLPGKIYRYSLGSGFHKSKISLDIVFPLSSVKFEGFDFLAPKDTDRYLKNLYGNYNQLPPEESIRKHTSEVKIY